MNRHFHTMQKKYFIFLTVLIMAVTSYAHAKEKIPDRFRIALGGFAVVRYDSLMSLIEPNLGAGISISPEDTLGLSTEQVVLRLEGYYRFTKKHAMTYSWYKITSDGSKILGEEFEWLDDNGDTITVIAWTVEGEKKLKRDTKFYVNEGPELKFHTSCSDDITYDSFLPILKQ